MIIILNPDVAADGPEVQQLLAEVARHPKISTRVHTFKGTAHQLTEVHLIGETRAVPVEPFAELPFVTRVVRVSEKYRLVGRHEGQVEAHGFTYRGVRFSQDTLHVFAGLCAVDTRE